MPNTNFQTILQMPGIVNDIVKQATGRESVSQIDMDFVTVAQDKQTVPHEIDYTALASFVNNNQLPLTVLAKITAVQSGEGDPAPDNVRPITGWTGVNVTRCGKNLYDRENGKYNVPVYGMDGTQASYPDVNVVWIKAKPNTDYTITINPNPVQIYLRWINCDKNRGFINRQPTITQSNSPFVLRTTSNTEWVQIAVNQYNASNIDKNNWEICIKEDTATSYEPYQGETYDITFPSEAGTVYGGTINVTTGLLTVDMAIVDMGTLTWKKSQNNNNGFYSTLQSNKYALGDVIMLCETYGFGGAVNSDYYENAKIKCYKRVENSYPAEIYVMDTRFTDVSLFTTAMLGVHLVYKLETPVTYQLAPTEIDSLIGENNLYADTGDVSVSYTSYIPVP